MPSNDPWDVETNLAWVSRQWPGLLALCDDEAAFRASAPDVSQWDVGQHIYHCSIALNRIVGAIDMMLADPNLDVGKGPTVEFAKPMLESTQVPRGVAKAADFLIPPADPDRAETRGMVESAQGLWNGLNGKADQIRVSKSTFPHFLLGHFTSREWIRFMAVHTAHHFKIMRDVLEASGIAVPFEADVEAA